MTHDASAPLRLLRCRIETQGYTGLSDGQLHALDPWLRLTPFLTGLIAALSTIMASPLILGILATILALGVVLPRHPFDILYNRFILPLENSPRLPQTPARRRLVYAILCSLLVTAAWCLVAGHRRWGIAIGWVVAMDLAVMAAHQICVISEVVRRLSALRNLRRG
jgi:hypothetical protein